MRIGEQLYKAQAGGDGGQGGPGGQDGGQSGGQPGGQGGGDEKVVDADFEEVDERKGKSAN